jgi:outer membrane receptor protein involved in Fe transport
MGTVNFQHIFSANAIGWLRGMVRNKSRNLTSNTLSWPIAAEQHNELQQGYFSASLSLHRKRHDWKFGIESDNFFLNEKFSYQIPFCVSSTDLALNPPQCPINVGIFEEGTLLAFPAGGGFFTANRPELEQSAYVQDTIRLGNWTINAGLRWDHYQLIANQNAVSPRVAVSRYLPTYGVLLHASYDRIFQTPDFENILLASSPDVVSLSPSVLRLPVEPSHGNYYEFGATKGFSDKLRLDVNYFLRRQNNVSDDDQLLSTAVAFPIAWDHASIYGVEGKLTVPRWWRFSGWASYSYQVGKVFPPVKGGLFVGQEAVELPTTGHFPATQDQRHTMRARIRYQIIPRLWAAFGLEYGSGLPFEATLTEEQAAAIYGQQVLEELNFDKGRIKPVLLESASIGADLYEKKGREVRLQADVANLSDKLHVIDFGGLFSGTAIGPERSFSIRLTGRF